MDNGVLDLKPVFLKKICNAVGDHFKSRRCCASFFFRNIAGCIGLIMLHNRQFVFPKWRLLVDGPAGCFWVFEGDVRSILVKLEAGMSLPKTLFAFCVWTMHFCVLYHCVALCI